MTLSRATIYKEYHYAECYYVECHYAQCRYAECRGANLYACQSYETLFRTSKVSTIKLFCAKITSDFVIS
jgi:hypothetical protein